MNHKTLLLAAPLLLVACDAMPGTTCNAMYSPDQVHMTFEDVAFEEGSWRLTIDGDIVCEFELPIASNDNVECIGGNEIYVVPSNDGDGIDEVSIWEFAPDRFDATLHLNDELFAEASFEPEYSIDEPNGEGCGERSFAEVSF